MLHETQVAADTGSFNAILEGGSVTYVHGGTIDQPLEVYKTSTNLILPYTNWHGQFVRGTCVGGGCAGVQYPLSDASAYDDIPGGVAQGTWFGTLIKGQLDASGYEYKRNRYYNPSTGRFNQEDPIGLAGGLNVYGFANGDPANYSDPFGLCVEDLCVAEGALAVVGAEAFAPGLLHYVGAALETAVVNASLHTLSYATKAGVTVIGKIGQIQLKLGESVLHLPNQGGIRENWNANSSKLRQVIRERGVIRDAHVNTDGSLRDDRKSDGSASFLTAERNLLRNQGYTYDSQSKSWSPPQQQ